ncbi:MAG: zinc ribbon domain-containing protein [Methanobacteriaceae archaeon]|jgi:predicted amidophosphoribosyltransferase
MVTSDEIKKRLEARRKGLDPEKQSNICPNCGTEISENAVFCIGCGEKLKEKSVETIEMEGTDNGLVETIEI